MKLKNINKGYTNRFNGESLAILIREGGTNRKMKPFLSPIMGSAQFFTVAIVPNERAIGKGSKLKNELKACYHGCLHHKQGSCYVAQFRELTNSHKPRSEELREASKDFFLIPNTYTLRLTSWGDIGVLNDEGLDLIHDLALNAKRVLGYTSAFNESYMRRFQPFMLASVQNSTQRNQALSMGWKVYDSSSDSFASFKHDVKELGGKGVKCMVKEDNHPSEALKGCSVCSTPCGSSPYSVKSPNKKEIEQARKRFQNV